MSGGESFTIWNPVAPAIVEGMINSPDWIMPVNPPSLGLSCLVCSDR